MAANTAVHSTAFNFLSFVRSGVDARTGLYTVSLSLPEVKTCELSGPVIPLSLNFNPLNTTDAGFGVGWELALTQYEPSTQIISVHSGETFRVTGPYPGFADRLRMKEQKIENFKLFSLPDNRFKVVHKSGLVEILEPKGATPQVAVPVKIYSAQGHEVTLEYISANGKPMLSAMRDNTGAVLRVTRETDKNTVTFALGIVNGTPSAQVLLNLKSDRVDRITLPTTEGAGWRFEYRREKGLDCISEVWTPLGAHETVLYNDNGHGFPGNDTQRKLPRVTDHTLDPGGGNPPTVLKYTYSPEGHNFLGFGSGVDWDDDGLDNLFKVLKPYFYTTTESLMEGTDTVRSITRTFNRFHLQTQEIIAQGNHQKTIRTRYYADDDDKLSFDNQPRQCQLAKATSTLWSISDDPRFWRMDREFSEYDIHGNQTLQVASSGMTERISYYPAEGVNGLCPPDPHGFVRHVHEKTVTPASNPEQIADLAPGAPTLRTRFRYESLPPITPVNASPITERWLCVVEERLYEVPDTPGSPSNSLAQEPMERQLSLTVFDYIDAPANSLTHGRRSRQAITMGDDNGPTSFIDYSYTKNTANLSLRTEQRSSTDFDSTERTVVDERSMLNGEPLLVTENGIQHSYRYDALNRVLSETQAPDSEYSASRRYSYRLIRPADAGQNPVTTQAYQQLEDVKGVRVRTHFDGLSRVVREEMEDPDHSNASFRDIYTAKYNAKGFLIEETEIDWLETTDLRLTTSYTYDLWGLEDSLTRPDGVKQWTLNNPIAFTTEEWIDGTARTRTVTNRFDKPERIEQVGVDGRLISQTAYQYDGLGNCTQEIDELGQITRYHYDASARLTSTTLPDLTIIHNTYAAHSPAELRTAIEVEPGNIQMPFRQVGAQQFDGLDRLVSLTVGPRTQQLVYDAGHYQPKHRVTPSGNQIDYQYKLGLSETPTLISTPDDESSFEIDLLDARLDSSKNSQGEYQFSYDEAGRLIGESWTDAVDNKTYTTRYKTSLKGRRLSRTDIGNHQTRMDYDPHNGRLRGIEQGQLQAAFEYDGIGRLFRTTSTDKTSGNTLTTTLEFDERGRETLRTLVLLDAQGQPLEAERTLELTYLADSNVQSRHLKVGGASALLETYSYDLRGRLERYRCSGSDLPTDRYGNAIISQYFEFDALDNIIFTRTVFSDGRLDIAHFTFAEDDPCQLVSASHSHPDYQHLESRFSYDPDGNLEHDELGKRLSYDSLGRLVQVKTAAGVSLTAYRYDPHDQLQAITPQGEAQTLRFYQGTRLTDTLHDNHHVQFLYHEGQPLGQQTPGDNDQTLLLLTDAKRSVIAENQGSEVRSTVYGAYGERDENTAMQSLLAFNGEALESTGWYLLGNGYRVYNPSLMRFHSPDALSPFGAGGLNCYMYCAGNPIVFSDPTGHEAQGQLLDNPWVSAGAGVFTMLLGIAISVLTLDPAPFIAAVATAAGVSSQTATIATVAVTTAVNSLIVPTAVGSSVAAIGVDVGSMFMQDPGLARAAMWAGTAIGTIGIPKFKVPTIKVPAIKAPTIKPPTNWILKARQPQQLRKPLPPAKRRVWEEGFPTPTARPSQRVDTPPVSKAPTPREGPSRAGSLTVDDNSVSVTQSVESLGSSGPTRTRASGELPSAVKDLLARDQALLERNVVSGGQMWYAGRRAGMAAEIVGIHIVNAKPTA
ncbi:RHS repeat-associated core domain-containing protein [Pseudomonas sp. MS646]|uniref:RHS repeat domain-containing protein n=1 Tax=Pseudomonas sp. MS646 TaxID=3118751 RepID=UPI0030D3E62A